MGRSVNKEAETSVSTPERRSLRHSKPQEEDVKTNSPLKPRKSIGKKKEVKGVSQDKDKGKEKEEEEEPEIVEEVVDEDAHPSSSEAEKEALSPKPASSRSARGSRKRQASEVADVEEDANGKTEEDQGDGKNNNELKNGQKEGTVKNKSKKKRKPPTKKKKVEEDEAEMWTPLEPLDGEERRDTSAKIQSKSDRRKQALVERKALAEPMLQKQPPRQRKNSNTSECEVLDSAPGSHRRPKTIVTVDIDDEVSETGSIQIVAEPDVDSVFDFKRLLIQYRNVNLPSSLWGVHKDPRNRFVSFSRFNPDYPETNGILVDRAVVFKGSLNPEAFVNGENFELPEMFNVVETLLEASQVMQFVNNTVSPICRTSEEPSNEG